MERWVQPAAVALLMTGAFSSMLNLAAIGLEVSGSSVAAILGDAPGAGEVARAAWSIGYYIAGFAAHAFVFYAGLKMMRLERYGVAVAGALTAIFPLFCCPCTNVPVGIWALVVLLMADTRRAFTS